MSAYDEYGDQYNLAGNVTFSAANVDIAVSKPIEEAQGDITFVPTYQSVPVSTDVFTLNVNEEYKGYPAGSLFVSNFRTVRPFEAYVISRARSRAYISVRGLGGDDDDDATAITERTIDGGDMVKVYNLSGVLVKQSTKEDALKGLAKGVYIVNGKRVMVK